MVPAIFSFTGPVGALDVGGVPGLVSVVVGLVGADGVLVDEGEGEGAAPPAPLEQAAAKTAVAMHTVVARVIRESAVIAF
jgi:hypothetical protein